MENHQYFLNQRRLRASSHIRELAATVMLNYKQFIQPIFVEEALALPRNIKGLPHIQVDTLNTIIATIQQDINGGITKFLLFPIPLEKKINDFNYDFASLVVNTIKNTFKEKIWLALDICLCSYTTHGHCGILNKASTMVENHQSVQELAKYALRLAAAGADCIAPSDMMDGRIAAIRTLLNQHHFEQVSIMSYSAKFSSQFYGPFRDACNSTPNSVSLKDRKTYQISPFNQTDAIASALRDKAEGADIIMVKPAALYTDIISAIKAKSNVALAAYHVSGEYASIELMHEQQLLERSSAHIEVWAALKRSGADIIISYAARNAKAWIENHLM